MSQLDRFLDDALAGFDDEDEGYQPGSPPGNSVPGSVSSPAAASRGIPSSPPRAHAVQQSSSHGQIDVGHAGSSAAPAPAAASSQAKGLPSLQFDPLKRKQKAKPAAAGSGAAAGAAAAAVDAGSGDASRPALTPQVQQLQEDLAKLVSEWSQAMHPEADADEPAAAAANQQRSGTSVLAALAEQTQRTVEQQARMRPPPPAGPAAAAATAGAEGGGEMNAIVDVVMQHLLSKDVLYQPMKEIMDKYPPWLDRQTAAAAGSSSSSRMSSEELERYKAQYDCITQLVAAYENEPDNTPKIMDLLQAMQACGEPPAEIVAEMSSAIAADLPPGAAGDESGDGNAAGGMNFDGLDFGDVDLEALPQELKNCPVQ